MYYSYSKFVIDFFGMFVLTFRTYQLYCDFCLRNNYDFFGKGNEHSQKYNYNKLTNYLSLNRYV